MMVLAVDVIGDGAADSHETGSRRHREKPAHGHDEVDDLD